MIQKLRIKTGLLQTIRCFTFSKNSSVCLLFLLLLANTLYAQSVPETDPLQGFDEAAVLQEFRQREGSELQHPEIYQQFLDFKKQEYIGIKNGTWGQTSTPVSTLSVRSGECGNLDFETGDFSEWSGKRGNNPGCCNTTGFGIVGINAAVNDANAQHTIVTGTGTDPCGGFPLNAPALPGQVQGTYSCRLGNAATGGKAEQLEIQFTPSATNNIFTYQYAVVLQNAGHGQNDQPFFRVQMFDSNNNPIPCTAVTYIAEFGQTGDDFQPSPNCNGVSFLPWSTVSVDLTAYLNTNVTIRFTTADCTAGGHYGYGYVNTECTQIVVTQQDSLCAGGSVTLNAPVEADNTYNWTGPGGPYTGQSISVSQPGTYNVTMTSATGCVKALSYTVIQYPTAILDPLADQTICSGQDATLVATIGGAATGGTWTGGTGTFNPNNTSTTCTYTPSAAEITAGTAILIFTTNNPEGPCPAVGDTLVITINPKATVSASTDQTICAGDIVTLAGTFGGAATTATWSGSGTFNPSNTTATATYTPTSAEAGTGSATLIFTTDDPIGPCPAVKDTMVVTINTPALINPSPDKTICSNQSATLAVSLGGSATGGTWSGGNGNFNPDNTSINCTYTPSAAEKTAGTVTLIFTTNDPTGPCPAVSDTLVITINPEANVSAGLDQTICIGNPVILNGSFGGGASSGTWAGGSGNYTPDNTSATAIYEPSASENTAGSLTLTFTTDDPAGPCPAISDTMNITINQLPTANAGSPQYVCKGSSITLAGSIGGTATSGTWSGGAGTFYPNNTALNAIYTPTDAEYAADSVLLTLTTDDPVGPCTFSSSSVTFRFYQNPNVVFVADDPDGCPVHCVNFTDQSTVGGAGASLASWSWDFGDGSPESNDANPYHCFELTGLYDIKLIVTSNQGCISSLSIPQMIEVYALPIAEFTPNPSYATVIEPVITMLNQSSPDVNYWNWDLGDGTLLNPGTANPVHTYPNQSYGDYTVTLIVSNANDCFDTVAHPVSIGPEFTFFIPNAFSPNGDGKNDYFFGTGIGITKYDIWIFDRWGNMIFHGNDLGDQWDGKANDGDNAAQIDVFIWKVQLTDVFNKTHNYIGTVTLVR